MGLNGKNRNTSKVPKFKCEKCHYYTSRNSHYLRHIITVKHLEVNNSKRTQSIYNCNLCGKKYNTQSGLWKHTKKCEMIPINTPENLEPENLEPDYFTPNMVMEIMKQNNEFKELLLEQGNEFKKQLIELSTKPTTNNTTNNFNLQLFLNETCKDALNISDFISQLQVGIKDLEETGRLGYADGISKIFINGLKQLEISQRPVHCSDAKRETIYIKDKNQWEKDDEKVKLTKAIKSVAHKNIEQIAVWTEAHPEYMNYNSKYSEKYMKLIGEAMPGATYEESDKNYKKIARNITKETIIEK